MAHVYILYSQIADKYYTGSCHDLAERLSAHQSKTYSDSYTAMLSADWGLYFQIDNLEYEQARGIEQHIKRMKSRRYIENLKRYPDMAEKLKIKYS
ncbi:MAG TPA: GIY-YIG nuclease family protein [Flavipsychrobacter sp.]